METKPAEGWTPAGKEGELSAPVEQSDPVNHPSHYTHGSFEVIDVIEDNLTFEGLEGFLKGNVMKYVMRYPHKNGVEDLKKARWYLDRLIDELEDNVEE